MRCQTVPLPTVWAAGAEQEHEAAQLSAKGANRILKGTHSCQVVEHLEPLDCPQALEDGRTRRRIQPQSINVFRCPIH